MPADQGEPHGPSRESPGRRPLAGTPLLARGAENAVPKRVYYRNSHGPQVAYFGSAELKGDALISRFKSIVGAPGEWETHGRFVDADHHENEFLTLTDGKRAAGHSVNLRRVRGAITGDG